MTENYSDSLCSSGNSGDEVEITNINTESCPELDALVEDFQQAVKSHTAMENKTVYFNKKVANILVSVTNVYANVVETVQLPFLVARTKDTSRQTVKTLNNAHVQSSVDSFCYVIICSLIPLSLSRRDVWSLYCLLTCEEAVSKSSIAL